MSGILDRVNAFSGSEVLTRSIRRIRTFFLSTNSTGAELKLRIARAGINSTMNVLDLGCGVGGCSRVIAATCGCRVTAIDLTPSYLSYFRC